MLLPAKARNTDAVDRFSSVEQGESLMKFTITVVRDEDGMYIAECPSIPGCVSQGKTEQEAELNIQDAIRECLDVRAEMGMPLTVATKQIDVIV
jgi:predicted RNase H-like HicB family nuclease